MGHKHSPQFLALVEEARKRVREVSIGEVKKEIESGEEFLLIDCREAEEFAGGHLPGARHLCKGVIERDIEEVTEVEASAQGFDIPIVIYCGGGYRSALAAENLTRMGYQSVRSMWGGWRAWAEASYPTES